MKISIIVAVSENGIIGNNGSIPWHLPGDLKHFKEVTTGHHIIMGRKTFESIGKALPERINIVITRNPDFKARDVMVLDSLEKALTTARAQNDSEAFIIGGEEIFKLALPYTDKIYLTKVHAKFEGDKRFPLPDPLTWKLASCTTRMSDQQNPYTYDFCVYEKKF